MNRGSQIPEGFETGNPDWRFSLFSPVLPRPFRILAPDCIDSLPHSSNPPITNHPIVWCYRTLSLNKASSKLLLTYLLTPWCSPSWEANWFAASQEIPRISRNPKVHYRTHKLPPPVSILGQPSPVHIPTSHPLEIHLNIIHPSTPRSPQWSPSLRFPHQNPIHRLSSPIHATCPAHLILLDFVTPAILGEEYKSLSKPLDITNQ